MNELLAVSSFMPHGMCYLWKPWLVGLHLMGNGAIALAYFSIPVTLVYILRQREDIPFDGIFILFAAFILFCGIGHTIDIWTVWHPNYWLAGWIKLSTGAISLATAIALIIKIPQILTLPSSEQINELNRQLREKIEELEAQKTIIRQQEQFLRSIYDNVREAIFVVDIADGEFYYRGFNPAAIQLTGIVDVADKTPSQILDPATASAVTQQYRQCVAAKTTINYEECLQFQGEDSWWLTTLNPIIEEERVIRLIGTSLNISDRKRVEIELDRDRNFLQALLDNLSDGIVACDPQGVLTLFNQATKDFHGLPKRSIAAERWAEYYDLYLPDGKTKMSQPEIPLFRALQGESVRDVEMMIIPKQGRPRTLLANGDPIINSNGEKIGAIVAMRDISDRKQAELVLTQLNDRLEHLNDELELRVQQRTAELQQVNNLLLGVTKQLQKSNQELEQFAYITSHDLKAPLRAIANLSEWIEEDLEGKLDADTKQHFNLLRGRVHRLENLINGLLAYSRVGRVKTDLKQVVVAKLLAEIIDLLDFPANFEIDIREMPVLVTEELPLQQVFSNLIGNAIKHGDRTEGIITISAIELGEFYEFAVADNGRGIDPRYHDKIFTIFQTLEARDDRESTGIGLAIVKKAVENQGGEITVESQLGQGTTFRFTWRKQALIND
jgi:PAS domain S-box-containing protein